MQARKSHPESGWPCYFAIVRIVTHPQKLCSMRKRKGAKGKVNERRKMSTKTLVLHPTPKC